MEEESSSAAAATVPTFSDARSDASATAAARALDCCAVPDMLCAVERISVADCARESTSPLTFFSKFSATVRSAVLRCSSALRWFSSFSRSSRALSTALVLKTCTARAMLPISSFRSRPVISILRSPAASARMPPSVAWIGLVIMRQIKKMIIAKRIAARISAVTDCRRTLALISSFNAA